MSARILIFNLNSAKTINVFNQIFKATPDYLTNKNLFITGTDDMQVYKESVNIVELNSSNLCNFIINNNINILLIHRFENCLKKIKDRCVIFTIIPTKIDNIFNDFKLINYITTLQNSKSIQEIEIIEQDNIEQDNIEQDNIEQDPQLIKSMTSNPKKSYRNICNIYSRFVKQLPLKCIKLDLNNEAVLVEYRDLPHLETLIRNAIYNLGDSWSYTIVCGNINYRSINIFCNSISPKIKIINTKHDNMTQNEYNNYIMTTGFWDLFVGEKILIYQEDTLIFNNNVNRYLKYDYVGAPFKWDCVKPINVGNGGLSLRSKSKMKEIIKLSPPDNFKSGSSFVNGYKKRSKLDKYPEDIYFPQSMQNLNIGKICPYHEALNFASEQIFTKNAFGMHCLWFCNKTWDVIVKQYFKNLTKDITGKIPAQDKTVQNWTYNLTFYILHCKEFIDRKKNIDNMYDILNHKISNVPVNIKLFNGINTTSQSLEINNQKNLLAEADKKLKFKDENDFIFYKSGQIGAYISHHRIIKQIANNSQIGYSIILEDDVILSDTILSDICKTLDYFSTSNKEFDIIFLGSHNNNEGTSVNQSSIYRINKQFMLFGAYGLLINNKNAKKLYNYNLNITGEIDNHYKNLIDKDLINGFYIYPHLLNHDKKCKSNIILP
jgi:GR25 family glycosyltransferase involved in LPS biosynthesis